jgi:DNA-binding response OmpR family regulator
MQLLIAEDDVALAGFLRRGLEADGYRVLIAGNGQQALEVLGQQTPDLMVLDLHLPVVEGLEVLRIARAAGASCPILVLTGRSELETRLRCLDLGADDCMFKPFSLQELRARIRAMLRRTAQAQSPVIAVSDLSLHRIDRVVERRGRRIALTNREYALLEQLVLEAGHCVPRHTLVEKVWGMRSAETNVVDVYINYLRRKLDDPGSASVIETVRSQGYRIAPAPTRPYATLASRTHGRTECHSQA